MLDFHLTNFNNGLQLVAAPLEQTRAVTVLFLVGTGSRYETAKTNGISHFLEHMVFKGTQKRPTTLDISQALDSVGASYNAFTGEEYTGFFVRASSEHFDLALDVLFDLLYGAKFDEAEIEKEKGVIIEEINMYQDMPQAYIVDLAKGLFYGSQALGRPVTGLKETVKSLTREDLLNYRQNFYTPDNIVAVVAGGKNGQDWEGKIKEYFDKIGAKKEGKYEKVKETQEKPAMLVHHKKTDQAHMVLGFRTIPRIDNRRPILKVLNNLFGETMSSRLFSEVREKRGLAYYISSDLADFQDTGAFAVSAGVDIARAESAIKVILEQFSLLKEKPVGADELSRAKENLKGKFYLGLEESYAVADFLGEQQLFWNKIDDPDALVEKYNKVSTAEIMAFAKEFFTPQNLNLALLGPFKNEKNLQKIIDQYK